MLKTKLEFWREYNAIVCGVSGIYLYDMRSLFFIPLFTVDKDDKAGNGPNVPVSMKDNGQSDQSWIQSSFHAIADSDID